MESVKIISIRGVSKSSATKLTALGFNTSLDLLKNANTPQKLKKIAEETGLSEEKLLSWVRQADLLRVPGVSVDDAEVLEKVGIANTQMLGEADPASLKDFITEYRKKNPKPSYELPTLAELISWTETARTISPTISNSFDNTTVENNIDEYVKPVDSFFVEMSDIVVELGKGIAKAQQALDMAAIETQKQILDNEELRSMGLNATWYAMPEVTFNLKMDYSVSKEDATEGEKSTRIKLSPINAKYRNYFKVSEGIQSQLNLKFTAIPPPASITQSIMVPDLVGKTMEQATVLCKDAGLRIGTITLIEGTPAEGKNSEVKSQTPEANEQARFQEKIDIEILKRKE